MKDFKPPRQLSRTPGSPAAHSPLTSPLSSGKRPTMVRFKPRVRAEDGTSSKLADEASPVPISSFLTEASDFKVCKHANVVNVDVVKRHVSLPMNWRCAEPACGTREDVVVCLTCAWMGCGRNQPGQHALQHFKLTSHALTMQLNSGETFCYTCDEWVVNDNFKGDIKVRCSCCGEVPW